MSSFLKLYRYTYYYAAFLWLSFGSWSVVEKVVVVSYEVRIGSRIELD